MNHSAHATTPEAVERIDDCIDPESYDVRAVGRAQMKSRADLLLSLYIRVEYGSRRRLTVAT